MKIKRKIASPTVESSQKTTVRKAVSINTYSPENYVEIFHSQDVKLSQNYQSAGCSYGVRITVRNSDVNIQSGIERAVKIVEHHLSAKVVEQKELLNTLAP